MKNCVEIVLPFSAELALKKIDNVQIMGGLGSAALTDPKTTTSSIDRVVYAPADLELPQFRKDGNKRDLDGLVLSTDPEAIAQAEEIARETVGDALELSFFGLKNLSQLETQANHPASSTAKVFLSDRYVSESEDGQITTALKAIFPFKVNLDPSSLETWHLAVGASPITTPIPHPGASFTNYLTRSISGLRPKDEEKVRAQAEIILADKEIREWVYDGPGKSLMRLAGILHGLRQPKGKMKPLQLTERDWLKPIPLSEISEDELMTSSPLVIGVARAKSRILHSVESNPKVVTLWQKYAEMRAGKIVKNN